MAQKKIINDSAVLNKRSLLRQWRSSRRRFSRWTLRSNLWPRLEISLSVLLLITAVISYALLSRQAGSVLPKTGSRLTWLVVINAILLLAMAVLVGRRLLQMVANRKRGIAGSRLHVRMMQIFSLLAIVPTVLVAIYASLLFQFGFSFWFSDNIRNILSHADEVARAYVDENRQRISGDILGMRQELSNSLFFAGTPVFQQRLEQEVRRRNLDEAVIFKRNANGPFLDIVATVSGRYGMLQPRLQADDVDNAARGDIIVRSGEHDEKDNLIQALTRFDKDQPYFLYVNRQASAEVVRQVVQAKNALAEYQQINERRTRLQDRFLGLLAILSAIVLLAAILAALYSADRLVAPIGRLVRAASKVGRGDLTARVPVRGSNDEFGTLAKTFNRMTSQLQGQTSALLAANEQLDSRRRFTEAVLSGVSAGVLGISETGHITLSNRSAIELLELPAELLEGQALRDVIPAMQPLFAMACHAETGDANGQVQNGDKTLLVKITSEAEDSVHTDSTGRGYVMTFDDVTEALADQRRAAWADVARRIAHEIKNPLTPIQLSAERLRRKYLKEITSDPDVFIACTDTIVRQVNDLRRMVDEFSSFARMPKPVFKTEIVQDLIKQALFLQELAHTEVKFIVDVPDHPLHSVCDSRQIGQALTNLIKNALEAVQSQIEASDVAYKPVITISAQEIKQADKIDITIEDNGIGLPAEKRSQLTEPYVTTRPKGTGLGLAIVKKIIEDHGGTLVLGDAPGGQGAMVTLCLPCHFTAALSINKPDVIVSTERSQVSYGT